jgi:serine/threonine-protein phosphatase PGAM5
MTGKRIAELIKGAEESFGSPCHIKSLRVSNLTRAKETASIIASYLPNSVQITEPDPMLNEGRPCHTIPGGPMSDKDIELTDIHHPRIEGAFRKYIYRAAPPIESENMNNDKNDDDSVVVASAKVTPESQHEFEIIVCHANVIRYVMCRYVHLLDSSSFLAISIL